MINDKLSTEKIILAIVILAALGAMVYSFVFKKNPPIIVQPAASPTITPTVALTPEAVITPAPDATPTQKAVIKQIIIKTEIDVDKSRAEPLYELKAAKGHYLIRIYNTNKLIYDGREIYSGENLDSFVLSHNGLHYAYVIGANSLYIDGQKIVNNASNMSVLAVANDGKNYFYSAPYYSENASGSALFKKDGEVMFKFTDNFLNLWINDDGSRYLIESTNIENGDHIVSLVLNGKEIYRGRELKEKKLSENGQHYAYITSEFKNGSYEAKFVVDGDVKLQAPNLNFSQITDLGHYAINDTNNKKFYIDNRVYDAVNGVARVFINNDASHYLVHNGSLWNLDGNDISLENAKGGVEIDDNIVYVYGLIK